MLVGFAVLCASWVNHVYIYNAGPMPFYVDRYKGLSCSAAIGCSESACGLIVLPTIYGSRDDNIYEHIYARLQMITPADEYFIHKIIWASKKVPIQ